MSTIPLKTMLRWKLDDNNFRPAVQTKDGILQLKCVINGKAVEDTKRTVVNMTTGLEEQIDAPLSWGAPPKMDMFKDFVAWHASLPQGGSITISPHQTNNDYRMSPLTGRQVGTTPPSGTDPEKLYELTGRFGIRQPRYKTKQKAYLIVGDTIKSIYTVHTGENVPEVSRNSADYWIGVSDTDKLYKTFAEIGDCLNAEGKPKITVAYRDNLISVAHLF
jgi:hypothetical protein